MASGIDGKQIINMLYHASVETLLTVGYSELGRKLFRRPAPKVDFNFSDLGMLSLGILLAMSTRDLLIKQGIIPADIMKQSSLKMASVVATIVGGAIVNAFAFSGSNYLFSKIGKSDDAEIERKT